MADAIKVMHGSPDQPLKIGDIAIECYVLEDERRVLSYADIQRSMGFAAGGSMVAGKTRLELFASRGRISPYVRPATLQRLAAPIRISSGPNVAYALEADVLPELCEAVVAAARQGTLQQQQLFIAHQCEIILSGLARVGIVALVDEVTGYQKIRDERDLQRILEAYVLAEHRPWVRAVPVEFFKELFRVFGWQYRGDHKGPRYAGKLVRKLIYRHLPKPVLPSLDERNPPDANWQRKRRHHQLLTEGIGLEHFKAQLVGIMALLRAATSKEDFERMYSRAYGGQLELGLDEPAPR